VNNLLVTCNHLTNEIDSFNKELSSFVFRVPEDNPQTIQDKSMKLLLKDIDIAIIGDDVINQVPLSEANKLKHIIKWGVGFDNVDFDSLKKRNINFHHTPGRFFR
jgi:Lactate dehydrogenase and related dehydrogenases